MRASPEAANDSSPPATAVHSQPATARPLLDRARSNLAFRSTWAELNGAMGDLGTYIPIVMALTLAKGLNLGTTLVFTGVYNILTGILYGVPMPVQPMKSIAAVAISSGPEFSVPEIMAAGILSSAAVLLLGATRIMSFAYRIIPLPVVRGVQLAQGLSFAISAVKYIRKEQDLAKGKSLEDRPWLGLDGLILAIIAASFIILINGAGEVNGNPDAETTTFRRRRLRYQKIIESVPSAVIVFLLGIILAVIRNPHAVKGFEFGPSRFEMVMISRRSWKDGFLKGAVPQIPLSVLNSVLAVCKLTADLFPEKEASATSVSITVGVMNLVGCWFGAMPCCHGAGGLAGQYRFGGRSGGCVAALGAAKAVVGLAVGSSMVRLLVQFPVGLLGVLLLFAGVELAMAARDMGTRGEAFVMALCAAVSIGSSAAMGFVCGVVAHVLLWLRKKKVMEA
ncbi:Molybdate transporter 1 [Apostasia shenzhenica]|uniref:Molybdate transporter 1 n=1 Tax=Apostasia shenzhenica TaxID=1088818 RepID=A0A2I0B6M6_9ASPA|nr:Molybdate transporter 1 [Apostasia shenzhenica]